MRKACLLIWSLMFSCFAFYAHAEDFSFDNVIALAQKKAGKDYKAPSSSLPEILENMNYDDFRSIRYVRENGPWYKGKNPFEIQFFHLGFIYKNPVIIHQIVKKKDSLIPYQSSAFSMADKPFAEPIELSGYAGFRVHYPLNTSAYYDELISFLGASYFRALGRNQKYGISARGIAIDTGLETGEEFPSFTEFWIEKPSSWQHKIKIYALLDSPSITGAYAFLVTPGVTTKIDVEAVLFPRKDIRQVGIAPLTSMYLFGENTKNRFFDFRPEVHDSDGLLILENNGEAIWRPLDNSKQLRISSFNTVNPNGFGLLQRDRNLDHYQDFESLYHLRPSVWVEPIKPFGKGVIQLLEIPSDKEIHDNVVAFFVPEEKWKKGEKYQLNYRLSWFKDTNPIASSLAPVVSTFSGVGGVAGQELEKYTKFVIDFAAENLNDLEVAQVVSVVDSPAGKIKDMVLQKNPLNNGFRLSFDFKPKEKVAEIKASLWTKDDKPELLSEIWSYQWIQ